MYTYLMASIRFEFSTTRWIQNESKPACKLQQETATSTQ